MLKTSSLIKAFNNLHEDTGGVAAAGVAAAAAAAVLVLALDSILLEGEKVDFSKKGKKVKTMVDLRLTIVFIPLCAVASVNKLGERITSH